MAEMLQANIFEIVKELDTGVGFSCAGMFGEAGWEISSIDRDPELLNRIENLH